GQGRSPAHGSSTTKNAKGGRSIRPPSASGELGGSLELEPRADANLPRRLELRRRPGEQVRRRRAEVDVAARSEREVGVVVVIERRLLIEHVEDVGQERHAT